DGIEDGHFLGPQALLPAVEVKLVAFLCPGSFGDDDLADRPLSLFPGDQRLLPVELAGLAVPRGGDVAVAPEGNQHSRARFDLVAGGQGQVTARRSAADGDLPRVNGEPFRTLVADPGTGVADVGQDGRQLRLG